MTIPYWGWLSSSPPSSWWRWWPWGCRGRSSWPGSCPPLQWRPLWRSYHNIIIHKLHGRCILPLFIWDHSLTLNVILRKFSMEIFLICSLISIFRLFWRYLQLTDTLLNLFSFILFNIGYNSFPSSVFPVRESFMSSNALISEYGVCTLTTDVERLFLIAPRPRETFLIFRKLYFQCKHKGFNNPELQQLNNDTFPHWSLLQTSNLSVKCQASAELLARSLGD